MTMAAGRVRTETALVRLGTALKKVGYSFTTVTPATHERVSRRPGNAWARDLRDVFGWNRPFEPDLLPADIIDLMDAAGVLDRADERWRSRVRFSSYAQPIRRAVDIGCGTAAGAIAVAKRAPGAEVLAVDINEAALRYARINVALAGTPTVRPHRSDLLDAVDGPFDLIIANPPFMIDPAGRLYRDGGGPNGHRLSLSIIDAAARRLSPGGSLVLFSGTGIVAGHDPLRAAAAQQLRGTDLHWTYREVDPDVYSEELDGPAYAHAERIALVVLTATRARRAHP